MKCVLPKSQKKQLAFTIIEMLVAVSIMILLFSSGMAVYSRYGDKQKLTLAAEGLEAVLLDAQNKAKTGYLGACNEVSTIGVNSDVDAVITKYQVTVHCAAGGGDFPLTTDSDNGSYELGKNLVFTPQFEIRFSPMGSIEIYNASDQLLTELDVILSSTKQTQSSVTFHFDRGGEIKATY